eukprot:5852241-Pleurochrysis_carterae.AAC.6
MVFQALPSAADQIAAAPCMRKTPLSMHKTPLPRMESAAPILCRPNEPCGTRRSRACRRTVAAAITYALGAGEDTRQAAEARARADPRAQCAAMRGAC